MQLWLVRHALAVERDQFSGPDAQRPLTDKGRRRFRHFARWLVEQTAPPDVILSSPYLRAVETARILATACGLRKADVQQSELLAPGFSLGELLEHLQEHTAARVALVGHEPDLSEQLSSLLGGGSFDFGKGYIAAVDFADPPTSGGGRLAWFLGPRLG